MRQWSAALLEFMVDLSVHHEELRCNVSPKSGKFQQGHLTTQITVGSATDNSVTVKNYRSRWKPVRSVLYNARLTRTYPLTKRELPPF